MKSLILLAVLSAALPACAYREGATYTGGQVESRWRHATLGTDLEGEEISAAGAKIAKQNQSNVAIPAIRTAGTLGTASILADVAKVNSDNATREVVGGQKVDASKAAGREATNQLRVTEETKRKALELVPNP